MKKISVCMATYNGERFIEDQLNSILKQLSTDDEIVISDDSSSDKTVAIIKSYNDYRIKLFENQKFRSHVRNFEFAINKASNELIFLSDQDDLWAENKVEILKKGLDDYDLVTSDLAIIDENNNTILSSYFAEFPLRAKAGAIRNLWRHSFSGCCMAFHRKILKKVMPIPKDITYHDFWIGFVANSFYKVKFIDQPLTLYRRHSNNASSGSQLKSTNSLFRKILFRWNVVKYLPILLFR